MVEHSGETFTVRDYLVSKTESGPWTAIYASSPVEAVTQFARYEDLSLGACVYVGLPAPAPEIFDGVSLSRAVAQVLNVNGDSDIEKFGSSLARDFNDRVQHFASQQAARLGRVIGLQEIAVEADMALPVFA